MRTRLLNRVDAALREAHGADDSSHETPMVDPKQNVEFHTGTGTDQLRLAVNTLESEFQTIDGKIIRPEDKDKMDDALRTIRGIVDRIETELAAYSVEHNEKPRSDRPQ